MIGWIIFLSGVLFCGGFALGIVIVNILHVLVGYMFVEKDGEK